MRVIEDSVEGEDGGVGWGCEDGGRSGEDGGGCEELGLKGIFENCSSSMALSWVKKSALYENWVNAESKLDEDEADERRALPRVARSCSCS